MSEPRKEQTCSVTMGSRGNYFDCGGTAFAKAENYGYLCKPHFPYAIVAGLKPVRLVESPKTSM